LDYLKWKNEDLVFVAFGYLKSTWKKIYLFCIWLKEVSVVRSNEFFPGFVGSVQVVFECPHVRVIEDRCLNWVIG
jgi:hypothetical protein